MPFGLDSRVQDMEAENHNCKLTLFLNESLVGRTGNVGQTEH